MNQLFNLLNGAQNQTLSGSAKMMSEFKQFASQFRGDPRAEVQKLLQSGQMTQSQLNQLQQLAQQFKSLMGMK